MLQQRPRLLHNLELGNLVRRGREVSAPTLLVFVPAAAVAFANLLFLRRPVFASIGMMCLFVLMMQAVAHHLLHPHPNANRQQQPPYVSTLNGELLGEQGSLNFFLHDVHSACRRYLCRRAGREWMPSAQTRLLADSETRGVPLLAVNLAPAPQATPDAEQPSPSSRSLTADVEARPE